MKKQGKKSNNWIVFAVAAVALLLLAAFAYAQENPNKNHMSNNDMMDMMGGKGMNAMHKQMTKNLDPETKEQMGKVHEQCEKLHEDKSFKEGMMQ
ncbi:hypothetical protein HYU10_02620 [Candidatus Woesearchaeota archaeon]|nr:hypothetical protein [Candidatus Woesearchaeota archaeon]MBI2661016.1 hypothetical protein [Candidatus Woesearchaeota archaeon]